MEVTMKPTNGRALLFPVILSLLASACAKGSTAEPLTFESGVYELLTLKVEGDCGLADAITPGGEQVGKLARVEADVNDRRVRLEVCNDFFEDDCIPEGFLAPLDLLRDDTELFLADPSWEVPGCTCFDAWRASRSAEGKLVADGAARLSWSFEFPPPPGDCLCDGAVACSATVEQRLDVAGP
jgi:hypothetical protein